MIVADINADMLAEGRSRAVTRGFGTHICSVHNNLHDIKGRCTARYCRQLQSSTSDGLQEAMRGSAGCKRMQWRCPAVTRQ